MSCDCKHVVVYGCCSVVGVVVVGICFRLCLSARVCSLVPVHVCICVVVRACVRVCVAIVYGRTNMISKVCQKYSESRAKVVQRVCKRRATVLQKPLNSQWQNVL